VSRTAERSDPQAPGHPEVTGLRPTVVGTYLSLRCGWCEHHFESYQPTIAGIAVGQHVCPECSGRCVVSPEDFETALVRYLPGQGLDDMAALSEEATWVAETWHRPEPLARSMTYRGVSLGPPTERELLACITLGLMAALKSQKDRP